MCVKHIVKLLSAIRLVDILRRRFVCSTSCHICSVGYCDVHLDIRVTKYLLLSSICVAI